MTEVSHRWFHYFFCEPMGGTASKYWQCEALFHVILIPLPKLFYTKYYQDTLIKRMPKVSNEFKELCNFLENA